MRFVRFQFLALCLLIAQPLQAAPEVTPATTEPEIVVNGVTPRQLREIVKDVTDTPFDEQVARWNDWLCFKVSGLRPEAATRLERGIGAIAQRSGVRIQRPGCAANVVIVATDQADQFTGKLIDEHPSLYRDMATYGLPGPETINGLLASRPVRWFGTRRTFRNRLANASHITVATREDKVLSYIIIDFNQLKGVSWEQLTAYLAVVVLTSPKMEQAYHGSATILSMFEARRRDEPAASDLTALDRALLEAYYGYDQYVNGAQQRVDIARLAAKPR